MLKLDLEFIHSGAGTFPVELFNSLNSFALVKNSLYSGMATGGAIDYNIFPVPGQPNTVDGKVFFTLLDGNLAICYNTGATACLILSEKYPYRSVLKALETKSIQISNIRMSATTSSQLIEPITVFETKPLTGDGKKITLNPTINPNNINPLLNDFTEKIKITPETGLYFLLSGSMTWSIDFEFIN